MTKRRKKWWEYLRGPRGHRGPPGPQGIPGQVDIAIEMLADLKLRVAELERKLGGGSQR